MLQCLYNIYQNFRFLEKLSKNTIKNKNHEKKVTVGFALSFFNF